MRQIKKILVVLICHLMVYGAYAATPSTQCPSGYVTIVEPYTIIGYPYCESVGSIIPTEIERITTCLTDSPEAVCTMFVPRGTKYQDESGEYQYSEPCALEP